jgi:hypothetical protein
VTGDEVGVLAGPGVPVGPALVVGAGVEVGPGVEVGAGVELGAGVGVEPPLPPLLPLLGGPDGGLGAAVGVVHCLVGLGQQVPLVVK